MGISAPGIGSTLDVNSIVSQLMAVEQQPITLLDAKTASFQAKLTGFGTLTSSMSQFQSTISVLSNVANFQGVTASAANAAVATVSATAAATPGTYLLEVSKLAQVQKMVAVGQASSTAAISNGVISFDFGSIDGTSDETGKYASPTTFTSSGSGIKNVTIDSSNNSLAGIRDAINAANVGVSATIVNDGGTSPYRLSLTALATGKTSSMKISVADNAPGTSTALSTLLNQDPAGVQGFSETQAAQNAEFSVDGIAVSKASNTASDVIPGITLNLATTNAGSPTNVTVARDTASALSAVNAFVKAYNNINQTLKDASAYNPTTKAAASLNGENTVLTIQTQLRNVLTKPVAGGAGTLSLLSQVGVSIQKDGSMAVDSTKLQAALTSNFSSFAGLFSDAGSSSDSLVAYSGATAKTTPGAYGVKISQLATQSTMPAAATPSSLLIDSSNDTLQVQLDGVTSTITLGHTTYASVAALAAEVQSKINGAAGFVAAGSSATVTAPGGVLTFTSNRYGSASAAGITGGSGQANLNFTAGIIAGLDTAGTINGMAATGSGQTLTGATGTPAEGLSMQINGGLVGDRGSVNYSQGYAYQFNAMAVSMLGSDGSITARTDGISASMKTLTQHRADVSARLVGIEARYRAQFTALDVTISSMTTTSTFLTQQLAAIAANHA